MQVFYFLKFSLLCFFLFSCSTLETKKISFDFLKKIPNKYQLQARGSVEFNDDYINFSLNWIKEKNQFKITLYGPLSLGNLEITGFIFNNKIANLKIDNKKLFGSFKTFMLAKYGWYLPLESIPSWLFLGKIKNDNWQVNYLSSKLFANHQLPKKIVLINSKQKIKITALMKKIYF